MLTAAADGTDGLNNEGFDNPECTVPEVAALGSFLVGLVIIYRCIFIFQMNFWMSIKVPNLSSRLGGANLRPLSRTDISSCEKTLELKLKIPSPFVFSFVFLFWTLFPPLVPLLGRDPFCLKLGPRENPVGHYFLQ